MPANWFYVTDAVQKGPFYAQQIINLHRNGIIRLDALVWKPGMAEWQPLTERLESLCADALASPTTTCPHCGVMVEQSDLIKLGEHDVCVNCNADFVQKIKEGASLLGIGEVEYATVWKRFVALFVDGILLQCVILPMKLGILAIGGMGLKQPPVTSSEHAIFITANLLAFVLTIAYYVFFVGNPQWRATPGKMAVGIRIQRPDGSPISYGRALGRIFAFYLSCFTLLIGLLMAFWDSEKRALHDYLCDTRVVLK